MKRVREGIEHRSKLREFVERVFIPHLEKSDYSKSHIERHLAAVAYVERFTQRPLAPEDLDDELVLSFDAWLYRQAIADDRRRDVIESIKRIARAYKPGKSLCRKRCQRKELPSPPAGSVREYYESIVVPIHLVGRTARYVDENRAALIRLYEHYGRDIMVDQLSDRLVADHIAWLLTQGLMPASINTGHTAVISMIWGHAHREGLVAAPPRSRKLPVEIDEPDCWEPGQVARFIECCPFASDKPIAGIDAGQWWAALAYVIWYSGIRRRAALAVRRTPPDVDLETGWLRVPGRSMKNRHGQPFRLGVDALEAIAKIWSPRRDYLFPFPWDRTAFYKQFHRIREAAELPHNGKRNSCLHKLRRSTATAAACVGGIAAAQALLGHSSQAVTARYIDRSKLPGNDFTKILPALRVAGNIESQQAGVV